MELFLVSTAREVISLQNYLYKMKISKEGLAPSFVKISEMKGQFKS